MIHRNPFFKRTLPGFFRTFSQISLLEKALQIGFFRLFRFFRTQVPDHPFPSRRLFRCGKNPSSSCQRLHCPVDESGRFVVSEDPGQFRPGFWSRLQTFENSIRNGIPQALPEDPPDAVLHIGHDFKRRPQVIGLHVRRSVHQGIDHPEPHGMRFRPAGQTSGKSPPSPPKDRDRSVPITA